MLSPFPIPRATNQAGGASIAVHRALDYGGAPLPPAHGSPLKLRVPTKLGFKNPKYIAALYVTNRNPGGYWENQDYKWFSGS